MVSRLELARLQTPMQRVPPGVWVKRDDLTGAATSGNKIRKLEYLLAEAKEQGHTRVITCGGVNSNHARATALASRRLGFEPFLYLRGEDRPVPTGNLLLNRFVQASIRFVSHDQWKHRNEDMQAWADELGGAYVIPEGGSNALGSMGYVDAAQEILQDAKTHNIDLGRVVHACGSGGTTAGLALGFARAGANVEVVGVAVCNDGPYFAAHVHGVFDEAVTLGLVTAAERAAARFEILEGFQGEGYAKTTDSELREYMALAQRTGLVVDPVYTGKAWRALQSLRDRPQETVFLHTGGLFELFAFAPEIGALAYSEG